MYVLDMVGTIILFIKEMYANKNKNYFWSGASVFSGRAGMLTNYLFLFGLIIEIWLFTKTSDRGCNLCGRLGKQTSGN